MNRMDEYNRLMTELNEPVPALENVMDRAYARARKREIRYKYMIRTALSTAAVFAAFVLLVNFCTPVAYACSKVPLLKELAEAVTFSRSLSDAVDNEYAQIMELSQSKEGITVNVEYLIVDKKQVNVFFSVESDKYEEPRVHAEVCNTAGEEFEGYSIYFRNNTAENEALKSITIDFFENAVPDSLLLKLHIDNSKNSSLETVDFDFLLEFDPAFTGTEKTVAVNREVILDCQKIVITDMQLYPSYMCINVEAAADNTAWLKHLFFYIETDTGERFDVISNGITAVGDKDAPMMASFRADSAYFYNAEHINLVITGALWLDKEDNLVYVNLKTGEIGAMPENAAFIKATLEEDNWVLHFNNTMLADGVYHQPFEMTYYDADGNKHSVKSLSSELGEYRKNGTKYQCEELHLNLGAFEGEELWLMPCFDSIWYAEEPIVVQLQ
ncbi:MAG: DUF4179 domain-containing protein [Lachnospiraceae bacterium]|nr:DUF4179 domain-containing protein [Lachnospiraceae bacterium]